MRPSFEQQHVHPYLQPVFHHERLTGAEIATYLDEASTKPNAVASSEDGSSASHLAVDQLQQAQEQLSLILENIKDYAVFTLSLNNRIATWNTGAERIFGYSDEEALGQSGEIIFTSEDRGLGAPEQELGQALEQGYAEDERWHVRKDQSRFFANGVMRSLVDKNGNIQGFLKVARDITARKQAEDAEREQRVFADALSECALVLSQTLKLEEVLDSILSIVGRVMQHDAAYILVIETGSINNVRTNGFHADDIADFEARLRERDLDLDAFPSWHQIVTTRVPLITNLSEQEADDLPPVMAMQSLLGVPVVVDNKVIGLLAVMSRTPNFYTERDTQRLQAFGYHAASAIRNAQLYRQAQELAALQERQQIARDLHDAVAQTLFTASLLVEALPTHWQKNPEQVAAGMAQLNQLIKGALAEMRTLILELRPKNIETTPLSQLLQHLVNAVQGRKPITISTDFEGEPVLPAEVHIAVYRLAQEALNNITKHARATKTRVVMRGGEGQIELRIRDDGIGFSPQMKSSGLGLQMMWERMDAIEAFFKVTSSEGQGTEVYVRWPAFKEPTLAD
jgi:PAS domain S-box-containing protein